MKNLKTNKINNNAKSYLAKLLATENISVEHKKVKTAYFDVKSRLLVLPIWKDMNEDITDLLIAHEVGHALFTPQSGWEDSIIKRKIPKSFLNVIEDARIEKLIKRKYPGLSQSFIRGYRDLINNNFFGTKDKDLDNMLLIDRLNIHFKSSHVESPIIFTDTYENDVVSRMEKLETFEDVINLAEELSEYCKEEQEQKEQEMETNGFDDHDLTILIMMISTKTVMILIPQMMKKKKSLALNQMILRVMMIQKMMKNKKILSIEMNLLLVNNQNKN